MKESTELFVKIPLKNLEGTSDNTFSNYISVVVLPLGSSAQVALRKAPVIAPFVGHFKVVIIRGSH